MVAEAVAPRVTRVLVHPSRAQHPTGLIDTARAPQIRRDLRPRAALNKRQHDQPVIGDHTNLLPWLRGPRVHTAQGRQPQTANPTTPGTQYTHTQYPIPAQPVLKTETGHILGIRGVSRREKIRTTIANALANRFPDRIQRAWHKATRPNQWWVADFTYVATSQGLVYASFVADVYTREILGFVVDRRPTKSLVIKALRQALALRKRHNPRFSSAGVIHHSDAGSQYTSTDLKTLLKTHAMEGSIGTVGDAYDNGLMESAIGLFKAEVIDYEETTWANWKEVEFATTQWVTWYNHGRLHSSIGYLTPAEKYEEFMRDNTATEHAA